MKFIEVSDGTSVKMSDIESIQRLEDGNAKITMQSGDKFSTRFFYTTLLQQIENSLEDSPQIEETMENLNKTLGGIGQFAG